LWILRAKGVAIPLLKLLRRSGDCRVTYLRNAWKESLHQCMWQGKARWMIEDDDGDDEIEADYITSSLNSCG